MDPYRSIEQIWGKTGGTPLNGDLWDDNVCVCRAYIGGGNMDYSSHGMLMTLS